MPTLSQARSWYPTDPVHGFDHVERVYHLAIYIAKAESADLAIVEAAALLHDADPHLVNGRVQNPSIQSRQTHEHASADLARILLTEEGWPEERISAVQHCILAHRFRMASVSPQSLEAKVLFDADKLDAIGAIGVIRAVGYAFLHGNPAFAEPSQQFLSTGKLAQNEAHSAYHEYIFKLCKLKDRLYTPTAQAIAAERHRVMEAFFEQLVDDMKFSV